MNTIFNIKKINPRQLLIHSIAAIFFMHAFHAWSYLISIDLIDVVLINNKKEIATLISEKNISAEEITIHNFWYSTSDFFGLIAAFLLSLGISLKNNWSRLNSILVFLFVFFSQWFFDFGWSIIQTVILDSRQQVQNSILVFSIWGTILLIPALVLLFSRKTNAYIQKGLATKM